MKNNSRNHYRILFGLCLLSCASGVQAQLSATELDHLIASDAAQNDALGWSVDVDGSWAVVGAPNDDDDGEGANTGAAYVYLWNAQTGEWEQEQKLVMSGLAAGDQFGASVAISGNVIVVGAPRDDSNTIPASNLHGSAHVFTLDSGGWDNGVELETSTEDIFENRYGNFGISVDIDGATIVVGVAYDNERDISAGSAFVFESLDGVWAEAQKLLPPPGADQNFGWSVAIDWPNIVVGAPHWTAAGVGEAYIFTRTTGGWPANGTRLLPIDNLSGDNFGWSVDVSGDLAVVGARYDHGPTNVADSGSASVFRKSEILWPHQEKLTASIPEANGWFGFDVATNGEVVMVGSMQDGPGIRGSVFLFSDTSSGWSDGKVVFPAINPTDVSWIVHYGSAVAVDEGTMIAGARGADVWDGAATRYSAGAAFVYGINATAVPSAVTNDQLVIQAPEDSWLSNLSSLRPEQLGPLPPDTAFPLGTVGFTVNGLTPGAAIEVELLFPDSISPQSYYKYSDHWYQFLDDGTTGAVFSPGKVTLKLVDGGRGDHDGVANGVIVDPGGPSVIQVDERVFEDGFETRNPN